MYVLWLCEPECDKRALVGRKAANLSASHRIPPGFCLTRLACDLAMARVHRSLKQGGRLLIQNVYQMTSAALLWCLFCLPHSNSSLLQRETHLQ